MLLLVQIWGGGEVVFVDGMCFVMLVRIINVGLNCKYFGNNRGIIWYNFVFDQYFGFYGIVILGMLRDFIFVLEGFLEQEIGLNLIEIMIDMVGVSDFVFGFFWLLGYQFFLCLVDVGVLVFW